MAVNTEQEGRQRLLNEKRNEILRIAAEHGASNVRLFGSVARGDDNDESDIDLVVDLAADRSLFDHAALLLALQTLLGPNLDVVTESGLKPAIRARVLREAVPI